MATEKYIAAIGPRDGPVPAGAGFLVTDRHVLTCAHVVNVCTGVQARSLVKPTQKVKVAFLADASVELLASVNRVEHWLPPLPSGAKTASDMAILTLEKPAPAGTAKAPMRERNSLEGRSFSVVGFPSGWSNGQGQSGIVGEPNLIGRYELLEGNDKRPFVRPGFSGSPVRCESRTSKGVVGVVGMVVAARAEEQEKTAYMIPTQHLRVFLSSLDGIDICNGVIDDFPHIELLQKYVNLKVVRKRDTREFDLRIKKFDNTDAIANLFRGDPQRDYDDTAAKPERVLDEPQLAMLLVQSPGGAGKSNFLAALVQNAIAKGMVPFLLDAAVGSAAQKDPSTWNLAALLAMLTVGGGINDFRKAESEVGLHQIVLFADRLNENPSQASAILEAVRKVVESEVSGIRVVIADRLKDRLQNIAPLDRATILPLPIREMQTHLGYAPIGTNAKLLATPFFLEMRLRVGKESDKASPLTRSEMFREFFRDHAGVTDALLPRLAASAFKAYEESNSTVMPASSWMKVMSRYDVPDDLQQKVLEGAMLQYKPANVTEEVVEFRHQLLHDFLAGTHLAALEEKFWRAPNFDIATLETQSYDAIEFAAERLDVKATRFLVQVYDWSWVGVLESVRNLDAGRHGGESPVSSEFKDALYFLNAVRLFDCFEESRKKTRQIIADVHTSSGLDFESVQSFPELRRMLSGSYTPVQTYFKEWKGLFLRDAQQPVCIQDLAVLWSDPFMSWTATSVFRRIRLDAGVPGFLQMIYGLVRNTGGERSEAVGMRWRIVHLLGVVEDPKNSEFLWSVAVETEEDKWVRSGAVRSYIENAALTDSAEVRQGMLAQVANWIESAQTIPSMVTRQLRNVRAVGKRQRPRQLGQILPWNT